MSSAVFALAEGIRLFHVDGDVLVFNPFSWETHLLNPAASLALELAAAGALTQESLQDELERALGDDERPFAPQHARDLLQELSGLRLLGLAP